MDIQKLFLLQYLLSEYTEENDSDIKYRQAEREYNLVLSDIEIETEIQIAYRGRSKNED
jgi:hypothetical protein